MVSVDLRKDLRDARRSTTNTFAQFARQAGYSESHLRSAENGSRELTVDIVNAYDRVLATGGTFGERFAEIQAQSQAMLLPWDQGTTRDVLNGLLSGDAVGRRLFVTLSGSAFVAIAGRWEAALASREALARDGSRKIGPALVAHIADRLNHLRHLDDEVGSGELAQLAQNELALIAQLLRLGQCSDEVSRQLYALASEASRQVAWNSFDQHAHETARRFFALSLRASATASDAGGGAYALSFMAVQCYSTGQAREALSLLDTARTSVRGKSTALMSAMIDARAARSMSKTGDRSGCAHMLFEARKHLDRGPSPDDPTYLYWVTEGEIEMIAGSSALELGDPKEAVRRFDAAVMAEYPGEEKYPRSHAIYMARAADAHITLRDLDAAVECAAHAMRCLGGVNSARSTTTFTELKHKLAVHSDTRVVKDFLAEAEDS
ncbi:MAG TPA: hypothetical protein VGX23_05195 [Actinocrinis sp.]|nr:hypothetical protein [Actinocrinis sp.]